MTPYAEEVPVVPAVHSQLENTRELYGNRLVALGGDDVGHIRDFYFDDNTWVIRYAVVRTGSLLTGSVVLLSPHTFGRLDRHERMLHIDLPKMQVQNSPSIESHQPVFRQHEAGYYRDRDWPAYWDVLGWGGDMVVNRVRANQPSPASLEQDRHLRSTLVVTGYRIQAADGIAGHVTGFLVDSKNWAIHQLVVEAGHWYSSKEVRIATNEVARISYRESKIYVNLTKADI